MGTCRLSIEKLYISCDLTCENFLVSLYIECYVNVNLFILQKAGTCLFDALRAHITQVDLTMKPERFYINFSSDTKRYLLILGLHAIHQVFTSTEKTDFFNFSVKNHISDTF